MADNKRLSERLYTVLIRCIIAGMFIGILGMIQPWYLSLFKPGFLVLLYSTLAYTVLSHITPRGQKPQSVGVELEAEELDRGEGRG